MRTSSVEVSGATFTLLIASSAAVTGHRIHRSSHDWRRASLGRRTSSPGTTTSSAASRTAICERERADVTLADDRARERGVPSSRGLPEFAPTRRRASSRSRPPRCAACSSTTRDAARRQKRGAAPERVPLEDAELDAQRRRGRGAGRAGRGADATGGDEFARQRGRAIPLLRWLTLEETAELLGVSAKTVQRDWLAAAPGFEKRSRETLAFWMSRVAAIRALSSTGWGARESAYELRSGSHAWDRIVVDFRPRARRARYGARRAARSALRIGRDDPPRSRGDARRARGARGLIAERRLVTSDGRYAHRAASTVRRRRRARRTVSDRVAHRRRRHGRRLSRRARRRRVPTDGRAQGAAPRLSHRGDGAPLPRRARSARAAGASGHRDDPRRRRARRRPTVHRPRVVDGVPVTTYCAQRALVSPGSARAAFFAS